LATLLTLSLTGILDIKKLVDKDDSNIVDKNEENNSEDNNDSNIVDKNEDNDIENESEQSSISYNIVTEPLSDGFSSSKLYVNNKLVDFKSEYKHTTIEVLQFSDVLIVEASNASSTLYAVDKQANVIGVFAPENNNSFQGINKIVTKEHYRDTYRVEGNNIYITTDRLSQDSHYVVCNMITNDDDIVVYEEKFTYLGNNKFGNAEIVNNITRKQYMEEHNINCNN